MTTQREPDTSAERLARWHENFGADEPGSVVDRTHRDHAALIRRLFVAHAELEAENTKLREDLADLPEYRRMIPDIDAVNTHNSISQVYFRAGLLACREYMARFVGATQPDIAASIRANWWPSLGDDPGTPRQLTWNEVVDEQPIGRIEHRDISPSVEALPRAFAFLISLNAALAPASEEKAT